MNLVSVIIDSSPGTKLSCECFDFELPVLGEIHGHDRVSVVKERSDDRVLSAEEAYAFLTRKYRPINGDLGMQDPVRTTYRDTNDFAKRTGLLLGGTAPVEAGSMIRTRKKRDPDEAIKRGPGRPRKVDLD